MSPPNLMTPHGGGRELTSTKPISKHTLLCTTPSYLQISKRLKKIIWEKEKASEMAQQVETLEFRSMTHVVKEENQFWQVVL